MADVVPISPSLEPVLEAVRGPREDEGNSLGALVIVIPIVGALLVGLIMAQWIRPTGR